MHFKADARSSRALFKCIVKRTARCAAGERMKFKYSILFILLTTLLFSCDNKYLLKTDCVKIQLYGHQNGRIQILSEKTITDIEEIKKITCFISSKSAPWFKGGYHGKIIYYSSNTELLNLDFNIYEGEKICVFKDKIFFKSRYLTAEGYKYLKELYESSIDEGQRF